MENYRLYDEHGEEWIPLSGDERFTDERKAREEELKITRVVLLGAYAPALFNDDHTSTEFDADEYAVILKFVDGLGEAVDIAGEPGGKQFFGTCEATDEQGDVAEYLFMRRD